MAQMGRSRWAVYATVISFWLLAPFGVAGIVLLAKQGKPVLPLVAQVVLVALSAVIVWGALRFRIPAEVAFAVGAAVSFNAAFERFRPAARQPSLQHEH